MKAPPARRAWLVTIAVAAALECVQAHVGSPDVFFEADAGAYHLIVTVRPPQVIPGVADVEARVARGTASRVFLLPMPLTGPGTRYAPTPDVADPSPDDPQLFTGHLWMMTTGEWQIRVRIEGAEGTGELAVPVPALASQTAGMRRGLAVGLFGMTILLALGLTALVGAAFRDAQLEPGAGPSRRRRRAAWIAMAVTAIVLVVTLALGNAWWAVDASAYSRYVYKPLKLEVSPSFEYRLVDPGWLAFRKIDDLVPDHGHPMHLFLINESTGTLYHVHPREQDNGTWRAATTPTEPGHYRAFADIVHEDGLPETAVARFDLDAGATASSADLTLARDDSVGRLLEGKPPNDREFTLLEGGRLIRKLVHEPLIARKTTLLQFDVLDDRGTGVPDLELYMGMPAHAIIVKRDWTVFAHVHSSGSVPMASLDLAVTSHQPVSSPDSSPHEAHARAKQLPSTVSFPYGFPSAGDYRIYVQVKRGGVVQTGVFDVPVRAG